MRVTNPPDSHVLEGDWVMRRPVQPVSLIDAVVENLRTELFSGTIGSNQALTEVGVATQYDVARPTAKAAIEKLVAAGLLVRGSHKVARVPELGPDDVRDIYNTRYCLEREPLRLLAAARRVPAQAQMANDEIKSVINGPQIAIVEPDMRFHISLVDSMSSPRISGMYHKLAGEVRLCMSQVQGRALLSAESIYGEHARLLELIVTGDQDAATILLHKHLSRARERLAGAFGAEPGPEADFAYEAATARG
ncbi:MULTISPECIES: GntR family transcriptional regulator [Frankia]|jgi:DNA-binding GntR family transcriptional regulator|nr:MULTISPECIES: GntR family transcriptional regulator [Frankia]